MHPILGTVALTFALPFLVQASVSESGHLVDSSSSAKVGRSACVLHKLQFAADNASPRSIATCADPSLARPVWQGFSAVTTVHFLNFLFAFVHADTFNGAAFWTLQGAVFQAWATQQPFTVPLFRLGTSNLEEYVFFTGPDALTPPVVAGFNTDVTLVAWVYDTQVCGSVPLLSAFYEPQNDHYYTTDGNEHADLLSLGWADTGVVAFVFPL